MPDFQQYTFQHGRRAGRLDLSEAQAWESISNTLANFANTMSRKSDANVKSYLNSQEDDIITKIHQLSVDNESDYDAFISKAEGYKQGKLQVMGEEQGLGSEYTSGFAQMIDDKVAQYGQSVYVKHAEKQKAEEVSIATRTLDAHIADTENMIQQSIDFYHENPNAQATFSETFGPKFKTQADMFANKFDSLLDLGVKADSVFEQETKARKSLYKKAVMAEMLRANKQGGDKAWGIIQEFNNNPNKFFKSRPYLEAMFQDGKVVFSEEDKNEAFNDMLSALGNYQTQQDRVIEGKAKERQTEWNKQYSYMVNLMATQPGLVTVDMVKNSYNEGSLGTKEHDSLVKMIQKGSVFRDDDNTVSQINTAMYDPESDQFEIYDMIMSAQERWELSVSTQKQMLQDLRSEKFKDITGDTDYQLAINEIKTEFRTTGPLSAFLPNESKNINLAIREVYQLRKTLRPDQDFLEEVDKIKAKYKRPGSGQNKKIQWNPLWSGTAEAPNNKETELMLNRALESKQISMEQFIEQMNNLESYMTNYN